MFDDYDDYVDDDDEFLYEAGSDDDEYFMNRDGDLIFPGDCYDAGLERFHILVVPSASGDPLKSESSKRDEAKKELLAKNKGLVADKLSRFMNDPKYSDVTLQVGPHHFHAHKIVLCSWSEVFLKMFTDPSWTSPHRGESNGPGPEFQVLVEPDDCVDVFSVFLKFMYSETVVLNLESVFPVLTLADKYMVQELRDACEDFLLERVANISGEEAVKAYKDAERLSLARVQEQCLRILEANISYLRESCVQSMPAELLLRLVASPDLVVEDEKDVYNMALQWMNAEGQQVTRKEHAEEIFSLIRFPHMPSAKLKDLMDTPLPSFLQADFQAKVAGLVAKAFEWRALAAEEAYTVMEEDFIQPRLYRNQAFSLHWSSSFVSKVTATPDTFRKLILSEEHQDDYYHNKLNFRVASQAEKNVYKYGKGAWEVSAVPTKDADSDLWGVSYVIQTGQHIGNQYRVALVTRLTEEEDMEVSPVITVHHGTVEGKFILKVPPPLLNQTEKPTKVWSVIVALVEAKSEPSLPINAWVKELKE
ncbi:BTB/POZ domain-containing protein 17-like [Acanthaster planci]|uniref:BTB/POZ domain-containing protein 17-like n=1 Tax=Acanthaster planci TaxID=133434 RepID=A0A8B7YGV0_ACAPL|nr:BTB/POZ domain-containing protein 17-like [Acanthaster planci]XP_022092469.1 BTB/POZ domain-containing protein 17-like [Acanthaster planci]